MKKTVVIPDKEKYYSASQWTLVRNKFLKNRMAAIGFWFLMFLFLISIFAEFIAPYPPSAGTKEGKDRKYTYGPPQIDANTASKEQKNTKYLISLKRMKQSALLAFHFLCMDHPIDC